MFRALILYLKAGCATLVLMSVAGIALLRVAPFLTLEQLIFIDWYGQPSLPPEAVKPFELCYLLFAWLSVLSGITLYYTVQHGLRLGERWAYHCYFAIGVFWPLGAVGIALYTTAYWYLLSASIMTLMFLPPVFLLRPFIKPSMTHSRESAGVSPI
jgi:hypothetical protein